jgi:hypothetical protein
VTNSIEGSLLVPSGATRNSLLSQFLPRKSILVVIRTGAFAVHAKDNVARTYYEHFNFIASPSDPMHLFLLLKDIKALID